MLVPVAGRIRGSVYCQPDRLVVFVRRGSTVMREFRIHTNNDLEPEQVDVVCDEPQVSQITVRSTGRRDASDCLARVKATIQATESFRSDFRLSIRAGDQTNELKVPIEVFVLEGQPG